jgi:uncharacterized membrane protein YdjX (TVP38/TMEM64 family)
MQTKKKTIIFTFLLVLFFILIIILYKPLTYYLNNYEELKLFLKSKGKLALFIIYFLQILQVVIAFIPSDFINLSSGYILGPYFGFLISYLGLVSGTIIAFYISRLFGKEIVLKFVKEETLNKISNKVSSNMSITNIFILSIIPFMPRDVLVYALGLTNIKPKKFLLPYLLARIPLVLILSITGDTLFKNDDYIFYFFIISLIILILYNAFKPKI